MSAEHLTIDPRFCGPTHSANGGYACGLLARAVEGPVEVRLLAPPPLGRALQLVRRGETVVLRDGRQDLASAASVSLALEVPSPPDFRQAEQMSAHYLGHRRHPFPRCFVCGPARGAGDGLRIFAGSGDTSSAVAAPWVPDVRLADETGRVRPEYLWSALDCPGYFATCRTGEPALLGTMSAEIECRPVAGERCVVVAWALGGSGRKLLAGTALFDAQGRLLGRARQVWIRVQSP